MKKFIPFLAVLLFMNGCSILSELTALTKCEYKFHSAQDPVIAGIDMSSVQTYSDLTFMDGQRVVATILQKKLPFAITANVEVYNPGPVNAAVNYIDWIAFIDDVQISSGRIERRIEIAPNGGTSIVPIRIETDLFEYLKGDNPRTMLNFGLNLIDAGGQPTRLSMKIRPSVYIGGRLIPSPEYFTISKEFSSGD
jgi:LEA14-like dessication related protein